MSTGVVFAPIQFGACPPAGSPSHKLGLMGSHLVNLNAVIWRRDFRPLRPDVVSASEHNYNRRTQGAMGVMPPCELNLCFTIIIKLSTDKRACEPSERVDNHRRPWTFATLQESITVCDEEFMKANTDSVPDPDDDILAAVKNDKFAAVKGHLDLSCTNIKGWNCRLKQYESCQMMEYAAVSPPRAVVVRLLSMSRAAAATRAPCRSHCRSRTPALPHSRTSAAALSTPGYLLRPSLYSYYRKN
ncbi:hypothetical protein EVAR_28493_1 [Eumeta japonica]|uniref:Uncharacterized protein n=1 Tax=Eumeta variegata TaxID=151549 RepID=A0A4C1WPE1_EUMVA|nr:hypothetical protein EVAR_28493_1 [Eumeta japonica]